jgi:glucuronate isomerase
MKAFLDENFLLETETACELYHDVAARLPIYDYHSHLPPEEIGKNKRFDNLYEVWLAGDHYKWRAMRANGVDEKFCTGDASPWEKFLAYARTVPRTLRNPLYHWTHLELKRYFGIGDLLDEKSAKRIWDCANEQLQTRDELTTHGILKKFKVAVCCSTDDPADSLEHHKQARERGIKTRFYPTYRPDKAFSIADAGAYRMWVERLATIVGRQIKNFDDLLAALEQRHREFHDIGCRLSDHGFECLPARTCSHAEACEIFLRVMSGVNAASAEQEGFAGYLMLFFGRLDCSRGWTKQLHLGALRGMNTRLRKAIGADIGCDSIGDFPQARALQWYLDTLDQENALPQMVLYNLNPADNYVFATMVGNFQQGPAAGKLQYGSGWWFLDQKEGMTWQINALSHLGLLSRFVGMLTDSRSFLSFPRHEYFRRILCNIIGGDVERGELPNEPELLRGLVRGICYDNAVEYFRLQVEDWI